MCTSFFSKLVRAKSDKAVTVKTNSTFVHMLSLDQNRSIKVYHKPKGSSFTV